MLCMRDLHVFYPATLFSVLACSAGNKLQQGLFIGLLYPTATPYVKQQWTVLNNFIALLGYYAAAW
jgi:hypothetical protein